MSVLPSLCRTPKFTRGDHHWRVGGNQHNLLTWLSLTLFDWNRRAVKRRKLLFPCRFLKASHLCLPQECWRCYKVRAGSVLHGAVCRDELLPIAACHFHLFHLIHLCALRKVDFRAVLSQTVTLRKRFGIFSAEIQNGDESPVWGAVCRCQTFPNSSRY